MSISKYNKYVSTKKIWPYRYQPLRFLPASTPSLRLDPGTLVLRSGLQEKAAYQVFFCVFFFFPIFFCFFPRTLVLRSELQEKAAYQVFCVCVFVFFVCVLCVKIWATREGGVSVFFSPYFSLFFSCFACLLGLVYVYIGLFWHEESWMYIRRKRHFARGTYIYSTYIYTHIYTTHTCELNVH